MKKFIFILALSLFALQCNKANDTNCNASTNEDCACIEIYDPVCGCDNVTYSNSCHAECAEVSYTSGACK